MMGPWYCKAGLSIWCRSFAGFSCSVLLSFVEGHDFGQRWDAVLFASSRRHCVREVRLETRDIPQLLAKRKAGAGLGQGTVTCFSHTTVFHSGRQF